MHAENNIEGSRSPPNGSGSGAPPRAREQRREPSWYSEDVHQAWYSDISTDPTAAVRVRISRGRGTLCVHRSAYSKDVQQRRTAKTYSEDVQRRRRTAKTWYSAVSGTAAVSSLAEPPPHREWVATSRQKGPSQAHREGWRAYHRWRRPRIPYSPPIYRPTPSNRMMGTVPR